MHIGERIRARANELNIGSTRLAQLVNTSKQNIYGIFKRQSIDTELLMKLSKALDYDFFAHYKMKVEEELMVQEPEGGPEYITKATLLQRELDRTKKEMNELREKYELLRKLYETKTGEKLTGGII